MFARLFSSKRTTETTTSTSGDIALVSANVNGKTRLSPSSLTEPGSIATNSHTNTVPDSPSRGALLRTPSPSHQSAGLDAESLKELFKSCPPKIVYSYLTSQIVNASPGELHALTSFFSELQPPSRLHCVRCHRNYFEVDNDDRSCTMPHDDDSAEVEHVKGGGFETRWDCCGRTVEGSGELGPPNGWCYEGKHTVDSKRARYRNDSSLVDDKLVTCARKKCFARLQPQTQKEEKRPPPSRSGKSVFIPDDARSVRSTRSTRSLGREAEAIIGSLAVSKAVAPPSSVGRKRKRPTRKHEDDDDEDEDEEEEEDEEKEKEKEKEKEDEGRAAVKEPAVKSKSKANTKTKLAPLRNKEKDQTDNADDAKSVKSVRSVRVATPAPKKKRRKSVVE